MVDPGSTHTRQPAAATTATTAAPMEGGRVLVDALLDRGVRRIFSVSGGPINPVYHGTVGTEMRLIHTRHEAAAGFMADATARLSAVPGVCVVTLGPGVTNTVTPAITALRGGVPLLIVGGQASTRDVDREAGMSIDPLPIMASVTKWSARVLDADRIPEYVYRAWRHMFDGRPGPVFLEIPADVLGASVEDLSSARVEPFERVWPRGTDESVSAAASLIRDARRPVLIVGDDAYWAGAGELACRFVEETGMPFFLARLARGVLPERHRQSAGVAYTPANPALRLALAEADVVVLLGHHLEFDLEFGHTLGTGVAIVQVTADAGRLHENRHAAVTVYSGPQHFLRDIGEVSSDIDRDWATGIVDAWQQERSQLTTLAAGGGERLHPIALVDAVVDAAPKDTIFVSSHGNVDFWADARVLLDRPGHYLRAGQSGALCAEIPYGIAARLARPDQPVIVFVGDGGFGYHGLELDTAARYGAPIVVVIGDDRKWGAIAAPQARRYGAEVEMDLPERDWPAFAAALGGIGYRAERPDDVSAAIRDALGRPEPAVVHVPIDLAESPYMRYISTPH